MRYRAKVCLERVEEVEGKAATVSHKIGTFTSPTALTAIRSAYDHVEERWLSIGALIEAGEKLTITVQPWTGGRE